MRNTSRGPQIARQDECKPKRQDREKIDHAERARNELPAGLAFARMPVRCALGRHPNPQCVLDGESDERQQLDRDE